MYINSTNKNGNMGREFLNLMDPEEVRDILKKIPIKRQIEKVSIENSYKRVLASDVYAKISLPPFDRVSMDGYALRAEDTFQASEDSPVILKLIDIIKAGDVPTKKIEKGTCIEVNTGVPLPKGANGVVMIEFTDNKDGDIIIYDSVALGQHITPKGSDITEGELLIPKGTILSPDKIGALSATGTYELSVFSKPKVAVISTGNELIEPIKELEYGQIYDINSQTILNAVKSCGCIPLFGGIVKDNYEDVIKRINEVSQAEVIITSGGTSAGTGDVLRRVLDDMGNTIVHGIALKPGKPTLIGMIKDKLFFGLPGFPVAALVTFYVFVAPFLKRFSGLKYQYKENETIKLKISRRYHSARGRHQYVLVKIDKNEAEPIIKDSGAITALAEADGYFEVPKNVEIIAEGTFIEVFLLKNF
jgi:molybdopterin molybdotransferase